MSPELRNNLLFFGGGLLLAGAVTLGVEAILQGPDDQPPIIVSNGSVKILARYSSNGNNQGTFVPDNAPKTVWHHDNAGKQRAPMFLYLDSWTTSGGGGGNACAFRYGKADSLDLTYKDPNNVDQHLVIAIDQTSHKLQFDFKGQTPSQDGATLYKLLLPGQAGAMNSLTITGPGANTATCTPAGPDASIEIR